jgi:hypothetical protein
MNKRDSKVPFIKSPSNQYYVFNPRDATIGWMDGCIVWWREGGHGYTYDLNDAGIFTEQDREKDYPPAHFAYVAKEIVDAHTSAPRLAWWVKSYLSCGCIHDALEQHAEAT